MAVACEIILVRHGQTPWNLEQRLQGQLSCAGAQLDTLGRAQAAALAQRLRSERFDALYTSDSLRAAQTAEAISAATGAAAAPSPLLRERHLGVLQGLTYAEAEEQQPEAYRALMSHVPTQRLPGGGESAADLERRATVALEAIALRHPGQRVLVVTHGGFLAAVHRLAQGTDHEPGIHAGYKMVNGGLNYLRIELPQCMEGGSSSGAGRSGASGGTSSTSPSGSTTAATAVSTVGSCGDEEEAVDALAAAVDAQARSGGDGDGGGGGGKFVWKVQAWGVVDHLEPVGYQEAAFGSGEEGG